MDPPTSAHRKDHSRFWLSRRTPRPPGSPGTSTEVTLIRFPVLLPARRFAFNFVLGRSLLRLPGTPLHLANLRLEPPRWAAACFCRVYYSAPFRDWLREALKSRPRFRNLPS